MGKRVLIVGGVAGGASAAARIRRLDADGAGTGCKKIVANCGEITGKASFQIRADSL